MVRNLTCSSSDHGPILIDLEGGSKSKMGENRMRRRHFEAMWTKEAEAYEVVKSHWHGGHISIAGKLDGVQKGYHEWAHTKTHRLRKDIDKLTSKLEKVRETGTSAVELQCENKLRADIDDLLLKEEIFWQQRERLNWLQNGDKNTKCFHAQASARKKMNTIKGLVDMHGFLKASQEEMEEVATHYFKELFTSANPVDFAQILDAVDQKISPDMNTKFT